MTNAKQLLTEHGLQDTFWGRRTIESEERGSFTKEDEDLAADWQTCACGKQDSRVPRVCEGGCPSDQKLKYLGQEFSGYVHTVENEIYLAAQTLIKIEQRAAAVLREVENENA